MTRRNLIRAALPLMMVSLAVTALVLFLWLSMPKPAMSAESPSETAPPDVAAPLSPAGYSIMIPKGITPSLDGNCARIEYGDALKVQFPDAGSYTATAYLKHDNLNLYVCLVAPYDPYYYGGSQVGILLDYENGREPFAKYDDLKLQVNLTANGQYPQAYRGDGSGGYSPVTLPGWSVVAIGGVGNPYATFEYRIPITIAIAGGICARSFGLAIDHQPYNITPVDYGWPSGEQPNRPKTWQTVKLDNAICRPTLPVFHLLPVTITSQTTQWLAGGLDGIGRGASVFSDTSHMGTPRFTAPNTRTGSLLEQYGASGGFFAFNAGGAFSTTSQGRLDTGLVNQRVCQFLSSHNLFPPQTLSTALPPCSDRVGSLPYQVTGIFAGSQSAAGGQALAATKVVTTGMLVQIPLGIDAGLGNPIPLQGPGGHLSLIVVSTTMPPGSLSATGQYPMLDSSFPGLAALAEPFSRTLKPLGNYTVTSPAQAVQALQARLPGLVLETSEPELVYYADDAAAPQQNLLPTWYFGTVTTTVDGHEVSLRSESVPAVDGFLPTVSIIAPTNGTVIVRGAPITLTGNISGGAPPYHYAWQLEDGSSITGTTAGGVVSLVTRKLPMAHPGEPVSVTVQLLATDSNGAADEASVALQPGPLLYLPIVLRNSSGQQSLVVSAPVLPQNINSPATAYWFGIEAGWDYPPYGAGGPDLPGVIPDAFGFQSGLLGQGWSQRFFWANASAWEKDWRDCSLGGGDCTYGVDRADYVYYPGHGGPGGISVPSNNHDSGWAAGNKMRFDQARWVGFASCATLRAQGYSPAETAPIFTEFKDSFRGSHMLLGFNSSMGDVAFGPRLVDNMRVPTWWGIPIPAWQHTIAEAWVLTAFEMNAGKPAYIWVVGSNGYNPYFDKLPGPYTPGPWGRPYPFTEWDWVWWDE